MTTRHRHSYILLCFLALLVASCGKGRDGKARSRLEELRSEAVTQASRRNFKASDSIGRILQSEAGKARDDVYAAYGLLCQAYYDYGADGDTGRRRRLAADALKKALETDNDTLKSRAYNVVGSYAALDTYDFAEAIYCFGEAKRYADATGARDFAMAAECNISEIYHSIGDTLGITYDLDIYDFARETDNPGLLRSAAQHVAEHYLRSPLTASLALPYIQSIDSLERDSKYIHDRLMGDRFQILGDFAEAETYYRRSMTVETGSPGVFLSYARLLNARGDYRGSLAMLEKAEKRLGDQSIFNTHKLQMLKLRADNHTSLGNDRQALEALTAYSAVKDSIQDFRNRQQVNKYRIRYELGKKELELTQTRASVRLRNIIVLAVSLLALVIILSLLFYIRKRNKMLSVIVERQKELNTLRQHQELAQATAPLPSPATPATQEAAGNETLPAPVPHTPEPDREESETGGISPAKMNEIWSRIQHEMNVNHIYRDPALSRDLFAEKVGCNHTWFSQVIKEKSGLSYPQFMNRRRIEEALLILADPASSMTHEELWRSLGFLSKATFYNSFKSRMSMSPAEYRRRAMEEL